MLPTFAHHQLKRAWNISVKLLLESGGGGYCIRIIETIPNPMQRLGRSTCTSAHSPILASSVFPEPDHTAAEIMDVFLPS